MKYRHRDAVATVLAVILAHIAWTDSTGPESLKATSVLTFYSEATPFSMLRNSPTDDDDDDDVVVGRRTATARPVPFDVDGDGVVEAIVVPAPNATSDPDGSWRLRVLDLTPAHDRRGGAAEATAFPFYPFALFESEPVRTLDGDGAAAPPVPLKMASAQMLLRGGGGGAGATQIEKHRPPGKNFVDSEDKARHYFCGSSWTDAAERCGTPCPGGSGSSSCPSGESCYADTPCDSQAAAADASSDKGETKPNLITTPKNGLPSVATVWSDGSVTMHSLTGSYNSQGKRGDTDKGTSTKTTITKKIGRTDLELRSMWRVDPFRPPRAAKKDAEQAADAGTNSGTPPPPSHVMEFVELDILVDATAPVGVHGAVILAARYIRRGEGFSGTASTSYHAIDAFTGELIWSHGDRESRAKLVDLDDVAEAATFSGGGEQPTTSSSARRRSFLPGAASTLISIASPFSSDDVTASEDCNAHFRRWVTSPTAKVLPHVSWGSGRDDARVQLAHFDRKRQGQGWSRETDRSRSEKNKFGETSSKGFGWQRSAITSFSPRAWSHKGGKELSGRAAIGLESVRPNVVLFRNREGVSARSLRNGRPVCHLSLLRNSLYADINRDGTIEQVQVVTSPSLQSRAVVPTSAEAASRAGEAASQIFVSDVVNRSIKNQARGGGSDVNPQRSSLCHILVLSGIPAREEVFSADLSSGSPLGREDGRATASSPTSRSACDAAAPILVEGLDHPGSDILIALNSGKVSRFDPQGNQLWTTAQHRTTIPTWTVATSGSPASNLLPLDFPAVTQGAASHGIRPILIVGEDGAAIISAGKGKVLDTISFTQAIVARPISIDFSGDGTSDIILVSTDAIWGYRITIKASNASSLRIMVGILLAVMAVSLLFNHFSEETDRRSTDV